MNISTRGCKYSTAESLVIMEIEILILTVFTCRIYADLRLQVTKEECGRSIDLSEENRVVIDYAGWDLSNMTGVCAIDITTNSFNEMICIISNRTTFADINYCTLSLSYHITGGYNSYKEYSCKDFNRKHLCKNTRRVSLTYIDNYLFKNVFITVTLFSKPYIPSATRRTSNHLPSRPRQSSWSPWSWSSWSGRSHWSPWSPSSWSSWSPLSWSSWTSSYDNDQKSNEGERGTIIGVIIMATTVVVIVSLFAWIKCCNRSTPDNQNENYTQVQYSSDNQHNDDGARSTRSTTHNTGANDNQTHSSGSQPIQPFLQGPPSYDEYQKHKPVYEPDTFNEQPPAPPPPYPGY